MKKIAVVLSGNGVYDGSEIHEATLTMLAIARAGADYQCFAPEMEQTHVINHITGEEMPEKRNVLVESARIARGKIKSLEEYNADDYDAIVFPGGFGVAKNLCTFAFNGIDCSVNSQVEKAVKDTIHAGKPIGALCISPVLITKILGKVKVTVGQDQRTIEALEAMGGIHEKTTSDQIVVDTENKIVSAPCYMLETTIDKIADGAEKVIQKILQIS